MYKDGRPSTTLALIMAKATLYRCAQNPLAKLWLTLELGII